jgi:hypothetical protein
VVAGPSSLTPTETLASWAGAADLSRATFIGDGAVRYADAVREQVGPAAPIVPSPLLAGIIGLMAAAQPDRAVLPHAVIPVYVRRPDAEIARARHLERP